VLRQVGRVDSEAAQGPVAAHQRSWVAPVAPGRKPMATMQWLERPRMIKGAAQDGAQLALGRVLDDRRGTVREGEAGRAGAQAEVDVLTTAVKGDIEPPDRVERMAADREVGCRAPGSLRILAKAPQ
jgi:hypothetical protein